MDLKQICLQVVQLSREVGRFLVGEAKSFEQGHVETKGLNDFVSYVDKSAEERIVRGLKTLLPEAGFIAEEGTGLPAKNGCNWIIDPLDGTTNFIHGIPFYAVSIALASSEGELLIGVVYEPNKEECFYAYKDGGAFLNGQSINVSSSLKVSDSILATGFPYTNFTAMPQYLSVLEELMQSSHGLRRFGAAALDLAFVACGRFDGFFEYDLKPWDVAAGTLLVREAGGQASTFKNTENCIFGKQIIASGSIHQELQRIIHNAFYKKKIFID